LFHSARFIVPECRISLLQFCFDILILMCLFCTAEFLCFVDPSFYDIGSCNFKLSTCFRVTNTECRIATVISPDDGHTVARNA
jgi:hypothetical protein